MIVYPPSEYPRRKCCPFHFVFSSSTSSFAALIMSIIDVAAEYVAKVNSLIICNIDGSNAADITVGVSVDNGSNYYSIASTISVPADAAVTIVGKDNGFYLDETDLLKVTASANSDLTYCVSYELMKDA